MSGPDRILIVEDEENQRTGLVEVLEKEQYLVDTAEDGESAVNLIQRQASPYNIIVTDLRMRTISGLDLLQFIKEKSLDSDVILITGYATITTAVEALKKGASDYLTKPIDIIHFRNIIKQILDRQHLRDENVKLKRILAARNDEELVVGTSPKIREVYELVEQVADADVTVVIEGESGTGKEVIAKAIHRKSKRRDGPFIVVNCGALTETLLENELFGHEKGGFSGASSLKKGRFELAHGGTIFLDELTAMGTTSQADFLRVLEDGVIYRVGGSTPIKVDVRVIAATNKNLKQACEEGIFRPDLFFRLNVVTIVMPLLRERKEDIPILVEAFLKELKAKYHKPRIQVTDETMNLLVNYPWEGNIRELRNLLERVVLLCKTDEIQPKHLPASLWNAHKSGASIELEVGISLKEAQKVIILKTLEAVGQHREHAAEILGISRRKIQYLLKNLKDE